MSKRTLFKALVACIVFILSLSCIFFSYVQFSLNLQDRNQTLYFQAKEEITEALEQLEQYLNLAESRLLHSFPDKDIIPQIFSLRAEHWRNNRFPEILSLQFISAADPTISYTVYGKTVHPFSTLKGKTEEGISYLGKGVFRANKIISDKAQKLLGTLQVTFSIDYILGKYFSENELSIFAKKGADLSENAYVIRVLGVPYSFVLNPGHLSFKEFVFTFKLQILSALIFGITLLLTGLALGGFFKYKMLVNYRALTQKLRERVRAYEDKVADLSTQLVISQNLLKIKDKAKKEADLLLNTLQDRYRQMAAQAQSIQLLTSKLISEEAGNDKLLKEIHSVFKESSSVLGHLVKGYPAKEIEEELDVLSSLEVIKTIFFPELIEKNITFETKGKLKNQPHLDRLTFEIVLHNIFHIVLERLNKDNLVKVELKDKEPFQIIFYDCPAPIL